MLDYDVVNTLNLVWVCFSSVSALMASRRLEFTHYNVITIIEAANSFEEFCH